MSERGNILIADDEDTFLRSTGDLLRSEGYACDVARDAVSATEKLKQREYDLLISDIHMPGNLKLEFIRSVATSHDSLPVILVTGYPSTESAIQSLQLPVAAYMVKPLDVDELLRQTRQAVLRSRSRRAVRVNSARLRQWLGDLEELNTLACSSSRQSGAMPADIFLTVTLNNIGGALLDLKELAELFIERHETSAANPALAASRPVVLIEALRETIAVLERSKNSFKSRELGALRQKLEALVQPAAAPPKH